MHPKLSFSKVFQRRTSTDYCFYLAAVAFSSASDLLLHCRKNKPPDYRTCCVLKGRKWDFNSKWARYKHKKRYPACRVVQSDMAELKEANRYSSDPLECRRHSKKRSMRRTRERKRLKKSPLITAKETLENRDRSRDESKLGLPRVHARSRNGPPRKSVVDNSPTHFAFYSGSYTNGYDEEASLAGVMW